MTRQKSKGAGRVQLWVKGEVPACIPQNVDQRLKVKGQTWVTTSMSLSFGWPMLWLLLYAHSGLMSSCNGTDVGGVQCILQMHFQDKCDNKTMKLKTVFRPHNTPPTYIDEYINERYTYDLKYVPTTDSI